MLLFFRNNTGFGGNNGLTDFKRILCFDLLEPATKTGLFVCTGCVLLLFYLLCRAITASKLGRVLTAVRDAESRVMFLGYDTLRYKLFVWTLSAFMDRTQTYERIVEKADTLFRRFGYMKTPVADIARGLNM